MATKDSRLGRSRRLSRPEYVALRQLLREAMERQGIGQRELSRRLGMKSSYVNKVLMGIRTLDVVELADWAHAIGENPVELLRLALDGAADAKGPV